MANAWGWVVAHEAVLIPVGVGLLDFLFAVSPGLAANGILHQVYLWLKGVKTAAPKD